MKKLFLILPLFILFLGCEEDPTIDEVITGTWKVTNMGTYANSDCSGILDYTGWGFIQAFGITMTFAFNENGTVDMTSSGLGETDVQTGNWTATEDEICIDNECVGFTLSNGDKTIQFESSDDASCVDDNDVAFDMTETECDNAGYYWTDAGWYVFTMTKQ
ncbi:MAG: hypothetical protein HQ507_11020 [Candidatus Marinimicrobia bacterium]|nr:hypothetical protein [Candidatus Neomarinimicrobiota bacterium]